ncbi:MAG: hypothetical protein JXP37_00925 [Coriobacteriia bacterium]|nr:hypothetical protein [Coriobacteriia bacterium]
MYFLLGIVMLVLLVITASAFDPVGVGYLLSSDVDHVADARLREGPASLPLLYLVATLAVGAGAVAELMDRPPLMRWAAGVLIATLVLLTLWDMRRRRGTLAVYIRIRRDEIGTRAAGDVIEVPKLMFLVMNQPTPLIWPVTGVAFAVAGVVLIPRHTWVGALAFLIPAALLVWVWARNRGNPWERLARRLRWMSLEGGHVLTDHLHHALDLDPEVSALRREAEAVVARFMVDAADDAQVRSDTFGDTHTGRIGIHSDE